LKIKTSQNQKSKLRISCADPSKLRFENQNFTKSKKASLGLAALIPQSSALKIKTSQNQKSKLYDFACF